MINGYERLLELYPDFEEKQRQPAGLDLKLGQLYEIKDTSCNEKGYDIGLYFDGDEEIKSNYELTEVEFSDYHRGIWGLLPNRPYIAEVDSQIKIGKENAQLYLPRSTLIRNGVNVYTAVGDTGYNGKLRFLIINHSPRVYYIGKGVRFVQLIDFGVYGAVKEYDGDYQEPEDEFNDDWTGNRIQF